MANTDVRIDIVAENNASPAIEEVKESLEGVGESSGQAEKELEALESAFNRLGLDLKSLEPKLSAFEKRTISTFQSIANNSQASGEQIKAAFEQSLSKIKSPQGLKQLEEEFDKLKQSGKLSGEQLEALEKKLKGFSEVAEDTAKKTSVLDEAIDGIAESSDLAGSALSLLKNPITGIIGIIGALATAYFSVNKAADDTTSTLKQLTGSQEKATEAMRYAGIIAKTLGTDVNETAKTWVNFDNTMAALGQNASQSKQFFETLSYAILSTGGSMDDVNETVEEFREGLTEGSLSGENLEQILRERLPRAMVEMANATGMSVEELGEFLESGADITTMLPLLEEGVRKAYGEFQNVTGIDSALNRVKLSFDNLFRDTTTGSMSGVESVINGIAEAIDWLNQEIEKGQADMTSWMSQFALIKDLVSGNISSLEEFGQKWEEINKTQEDDIKRIEEASKKQAEETKRTAEESAKGYSDVDLKAKALKKSIDEIVKSTTLLSDKTGEATQALGKMLEGGNTQTAVVATHTMIDSVRKLGDTGKFTDEELKNGLFANLQNMSERDLAKSLKTVEQQLKTLPITSADYAAAMVVKNAVVEESFRRVGMTSDTASKDVSDFGTTAISAIDNLVKFSGASSLQISEAFKGAFSGAQSIADLDLLRQKLEETFASGKISVTDYTEAMSGITNKMLELQQQTPSLAKSLADMGIASTAGLKQAALDMTADYETIKNSAGATGEQVNQAFLKMAESQIEAARAAGEPIDPMLKQEAASRGLGGAYEQLLNKGQQVTNNIGAISEKYEKNAQAMEQQHEKMRLGSELELKSIELSKEKAITLGDESKYISAAVEEMGKKIDMAQDEAKYSDESADAAERKVKALEKEALRTGDTSEKTKELIENAKREAIEKRSAASAAEQHAKSMENEAWSADNVNKIIDEAIGLIAEKGQKTQEALGTEREQLELDKQLAEAKGDTAAAEEAANKIAENTIATSQAKADTLHDQAEAADEAIDKLYEQAEADGVVTEAEQAGIDAAEKKSKSLHDQADAAQKTADKTKELAEATKEAAEAQARAKERAEQLKAQGEAVTGIYNGWEKSLAGLSKAALDAFQNWGTASQKAAEGLSETDQAIRKLDSSYATAISNLNGGGFVTWANRIALKAIEIERSFYAQATAAESFAERLNTIGDGGKGNLQALVREAENARSTMNLLDQTRLDQLNSAIEQATQKLEAMRESAESALDSAQRALLQEKGDQGKLLELDYEQKKLELQKQIDAAREAGDQQALANLLKAKKLEEDVYNIKKKKLAEETKQNNNTSSNTNTNTGGSTGPDLNKLAESINNLANRQNTGNITINADVSSLANEQWLKNNLLPKLNKVNNSFR